MASVGGGMGRLQRRHAMVSTVQRFIRGNVFMGFSKLSVRRVREGGGRGWGVDVAGALFKSGGGWNGDAEWGRKRGNSRAHF